jgi:hypothetical protein
LRDIGLGSAKWQEADVAVKECCMRGGLDRMATVVAVVVLLQDKRRKQKEKKRRN